ncbi:glycosyl transferase family 1 [Chitinophaga skermanii]|uniref:Glycosyl transferase family 1 n=1 Tax=Chitinophaga skermanii TaxID=331697 RepID=A0A327R331_9BACT|nr:glycosyltransferase [Chitinophaga skermanii]RAJ10468.1 glycosyl transferase family 1 [Chitinophaga skermanii]
MRIAVHAPLLIHDSLADSGLAASYILRELAQLHPNDAVTAYVGKHFTPAINMPANLQIQQVKGNDDSRFAKYWRNTWHWPKALKSAQTDALVSIDELLPLKQLKQPAVLVLMQHTGLLKTAAAKKYLAQYKAIVVFSKYMQQQVLDHFPALADKVHVLQPGLDDLTLKPLDWDARVAAKQQYAGGSEYFVFQGSISPRNNIIPLLKAFSAFKKRMRSNMKLIMVGSFNTQGADIAESLKTYKFRDSVNIIESVGQAELNEIIGGAYAMVHIPSQDGMALPLYRAVMAEVPSVVVDESAGHEVVGQSSLRVHAGEVTELAEKIGFMYKDEQLRTRLLQQLPSTSGYHGWDKVAEAISALIES